MQWIQQNLMTLVIGFVLVLLVFKGVILGKVFGIRPLSVQELARTMKQDPEKIVVIDVRTAHEFNSGHVKGSISMPLGNISDQLKTLPKKAKGQIIAVICASGSRSMLGATSIKKAGFEKVFNVSGGMIAWQRNGFEISH